MLLETRRTYRKFDQSRQISEETVEDMKKAARTASSAMNRQPLRYLYVRSPQKVSEVFETTKWAGALPSELGVPREGEKPTLYVVVLSVKELQSAYTSFDEGLAVSNMTLAAWTHGVGSCIIGSADKRKGLIYDISESIEREIFVQRALIDDNRSASGDKTYARNRFFTSAGAPILQFFLHTGFCCHISCTSSQD